jgi:LacI family transcriptional regulator
VSFGDSNYHPGVTTPTLRDVAREAAVHPGTASRALNPGTRSLVSTSTARRVLRAADRLGYRPNQLARGLKTNRTSTVGVLVPDLTNPLFPPIVRGIEDRLDKSSHSALVVNTDNDPEREQRRFATLVARQVDGFILATALREDPVVRAAAATSTPVVLVNRMSDDLLVPSVAPDDYAGIRKAVAHLVALGHRHIAHLAGPQELSTGYQRKAAFLAAMREHGLRAHRKLVAVCATYSEHEGEMAAASLLDRGGPFTAVVAASDLIALGCYTALGRRGLDCPADVSVVGFNDIAFVDRLRPPLTTIRIPQYELGRQAASLLLEQLISPTTKPKRLLLAPELVVRGSTGRPGRLASATRAR